MKHNETIYIGREVKTEDATLPLLFMPSFTCIANYTIFHSEGQLFPLLIVATSMAVDGNSNFTGYDRAFCIRMKSTLTKRGCHFKSSGYRVSEG